MLQELHQTDVEMNPVLNLSKMSLQYESSSSKVTKETFGDHMGSHIWLHSRVPASGLLGYQN